MKNNNSQSAYSYRPLYFDLSNHTDELELQMLQEKGAILQVVDEFERQLKDLFICRFPSLTHDEIAFKNFIIEFSEGKNINELGVWVYYPWRNLLVHLLDEADFIEVRTNRNKQKITQSEQDELSNKTISVIGLSVGQSVAITLVMERTCGRIKLADFDELDLSNLNRLRAPVFNIGMPKVIIAAREIAEIDPFVEVEIFPEGVQSTNYNDFFIGTNKLDLLIEVCDSFEVKVESRIQARNLEIPVIMETNDRGMLDVERFDLDPTLPIFHGLAGEIEDVKSLEPHLKMGLLMKIVNSEHLSERMKLSLPEIGKTLKSWPQLASEVVLGGGITAWSARKLLLNQHLDSGRYYVDLGQIIN